jgi:hypothetical protein
VTPQQIFDKVARHLLKQNAKSYDHVLGGCVYRAPDGKACAVGCLMTAKEAALADARVAGSVDALAEDGFLPKRLMPHRRLLRSLQCIHDVHSPAKWPAELRALAKSKRLRVAVLGRKK